MTSYSSKSKQTSQQDNRRPKVVQRHKQQVAFEDNRQPLPIQRQANTTGLPDQLKSGMENLSGMDLSHVKVHRNSSKPAAVQAHAYTQGADIHLSSGQEHHLPHELGHVVQQAQGRVKPTTSIGGMAVNDDHQLENEATKLGDQALQRAAFASATASFSTLGAAKSSTLQLMNQNAQALNDLQKIRGGNTTKAESDIRKQSDDRDFIDKANERIDAAANPASTLIGNEGVSGVADALNDKTVFTGTGGRGDDVVKDDTIKSQEQHATNMGYVGDSLTALTGFMGMVTSLKGLNHGDDTVEAVLNLVSSVHGATKTAEGVANVINSASGQDDHISGDIGAHLEGFNAGVGAIKNGFAAMQGLVTLIKEREDYSTAEKAVKSAQVGKDVLGMAKEIVLSIKVVYEIVNDAASGGLMAAIPGLDIAMSACNLIMQGYYAIQSNNSRKIMKQRQAEIGGNNQASMDSAVTKYRTTDAEIANKKEVIKDDEKRLAELQANPNPGRMKSLFINSADKVYLKKRMARLKLEIITHETEKDDNYSREEIAEYGLVSEIHDANKKRVTRQLLHISTEMAKIAGAVATLTGVGALAGGIVKGAAAAADLSLPVARKAKQMGRDAAARKHAKGKSLGMAHAHFDMTKSTAAKTDHRVKQVLYLHKMATSLDPATFKQNPKPFEQVLSYIEATGVNTKQLFRKNGEPGEQISMLYQALNKREF